MLEIIKKLGLSLVIPYFVYLVLVFIVTRNTASFYTFAHYGLTYQLYGMSFMQSCFMNFLWGKKGLGNILVNYGIFLVATIGGLILTLFQLTGFRHGADFSIQYFVLFFVNIVIIELLLSLILGRYKKTD